MSLGTAGLVISAGSGQTTVPVTPEEASADVAALGSLFGGNGASATGSGSGNGSTGGPVAFTGEASERMRGAGWGCVLMLTGWSIIFIELGLG